MAALPLIEQASYRLRVEARTKVAENVERWPMTSAAKLAPGRPGLSVRAGGNSRSAAKSAGQTGRVDGHGKGMVGGERP
jgi:hypothetical protein